MNSKCVFASKKSFIKVVLLQSQHSVPLNSHSEFFIFNLNKKIVFVLYKTLIFYLLGILPLSFINFTLIILVDSRKESWSKTCELLILLEIKTAQLNPLEIDSSEKVI